MLSIASHNIIDCCYYRVLYHALPLINCIAVITSFAGQLVIFHTKAKQ